MRISHRFLLGLALLALSACGSKSSLEQIQDSKDRLCACTDSQCLQRESKTFESFKTEFQKLSDKDLEAALKITQEGLACAAELASSLTLAPQ